MKTPQRPVALMALAQGICALAVPLTLFVPLMNIALLVSYSRMGQIGLLDNTLLVILMSAILCLRDLIAAACIVAAEVEALRLCGRMKKSSAFSQENVKALGHMAVLLTVAGGITLLMGNAIMDFLLSGLPAISPWVAHLLPPFTLLTIALMLRAVQLLMRRALDMQDENDLTV